MKSPLHVAKRWSYPKVTFACGSLHVSGEVHFINLGKKEKRRLTTTELLQEKFTSKAALKEKELEVKKMELELQQKKWQVEEEERKKRLDMDTERMRLEAEERRAMIELLKKLT